MGAGRVTPLTTALAIEPPPGALGWPAAAALGDRRRGEPPLRRAALALLTRVGRLLVEQLRLFGRAAALGRAADDDRDAPVAGGQLQLVAGADVLARLDRAAVDVDAAALDRLRGERASLKEARGPEPLVDAHRLVHARHAATHGARHSARRRARAPARG